jgi:peptidoglycan/xylan/chitin deacetylase (PgdA/CDA1 family)
MHYDFVPITERKPLKWPNGKRLALMITLNLEYWELTQDHDGLYFPGGPSINERLLPARIPDFNNYSWREYGHRVGVWRIYDIFDEAGVPASCTVNGILCEKHPQIVTAAASRDWELIAHNYIQTEFLINYRDDRAKEREVLKRTIDLIEKTTGRRPRGWLSSSLRCTVNTSDIIKELGLTYHCDYMNDEQPYLIHTDTLYAGGQRHRHVPAPQSDGERSVPVDERRVRRALPRQRQQRPDHEHRVAPAHHRPRLPRPGAA